MTYDLDYFINIFESTPDNKWATKKFMIGDCKCAFGHLGARTSVDDTENSAALCKILGFEGTMILFDVNDGKKQFSSFGSSPKQRVINYLKSLN